MRIATFAASASAVIAMGSLRGIRADGLPLTYEVVQGNSLVSAQIMFLVNENNVMLMDRIEGNAAKLKNGAPVVTSVLALDDDDTVHAVNPTSNPYGAVGSSLGNGTWLVTGGDKATGIGGQVLKKGTGPYNDHDGRKSVRLLNTQGTYKSLRWIENANTTLASPRHSPGIEILADGSALLIGGATREGYINRHTNSNNTAYQDKKGKGSVTNIDGSANPTYEYWPSKGALRESAFMIKTSGLNLFPHTFLMPSGRIFMQANYSSTLWDHENNTEEALPDMPSQIIRVYPASAAVAMLPMTKENNYTAPILFCGGTILDQESWGSYGGPDPKVNLMAISASTDCSSIQPEMPDGTTNPNVAYDQEEQMPQGRTMGQFVHLPTGQMLLINGAEKGTAGLANATWNTPVVGVNQTIYTEGLASVPALTPLLYDPSLPKGQRLTSDGFGASTIPRLYDSTAILLPDGAVLVAGSNTHPDVRLDQPQGTTPQGYNTTYAVEAWYPDYYWKKRPVAQGLPDTLSYGGAPFSFTVDTKYMGINANLRSAMAQIMLIRPGLSTHAMNLGQRSMQLEHTYSVADNGTTTFTVNQLPTNPNLFVPGPALLFVTLNGVPSIGQEVMVGGLTGNVPAQPAVGAPLVDLAPGVNSSVVAANAKAHPDAAARPTSASAALLLLPFAGALALSFLS